MMNRIKYITAFCLVFSFTSFKPRYKDGRKLLVYATINERNIFAGNDLKGLIGTCVELKIDTIDISRISYLKRKHKLNRFVYKHGYFYNSQLYDLNIKNLNYLKTLWVSKISLSQPFQIEPPTQLYSNNCIIKDEERGIINTITELHNSKRNNVWTKVFITPEEIKDKDGNKVEMNINSVEYYLVHCN